MEQNVEKKWPSLVLKYITLAHLTYTHLIKKELAQICDICNVTVTIEHTVIFISCPKFTKADQDSQNPSFTLPNAQDENTGSVCKFVHNINLSNSLLIIYYYLYTNYIMYIILICLNFIQILTKNLCCSLI